MVHLSNIFKAITGLIFLLPIIALFSDFYPVNISHEILIAICEIKAIIIIYLILINKNKIKVYLQKKLYTYISTSALLIFILIIFLSFFMAFFSSKTYNYSKDEKVLLPLGCASPLCELYDIAKKENKDIGEFIGKVDLINRINFCCKPQMLQSEMIYDSAILAIFSILVFNFMNLSIFYNTIEQNTNELNPIEDLKINKLSTATEILFFAANPVGSTLRLDNEMREVENQIKRISLKRDTFIFRKIVASRIVDLQQELLDTRPTFVHFSGHGNEEGIILADSSGKYKVVKSKPLAELFSLFSGTIKCVFLNSCYSEQQAKEISKFIPYVVGMNKAVPDPLAIQFSVSFYQSIASGENIEFAFDFAVNSLKLHDLIGHDIPILLKTLV